MRTVQEYTNIQLEPRGSSGRVHLYPVVVTEYRAPSLFSPHVLPPVIEQEPRVLLVSEPPPPGPPPAALNSVGACGPPRARLPKIPFTQVDSVPRPSWFPARRTLTHHDPSTPHKASRTSVTPRTRRSFPPVGVQQM